MTYWNFTVSCYEDIDKVTGGIGTYSRLLLSLLGRDIGQNFRVAAFTGKKVPHSIQSEMPHVTFFTVGPDEAFAGRDVNNVGNEHDHYSLLLARLLERMTADGHRFGRFEFPDYGAEGYFPLKARRAGRVFIDQAVVRLHSPELMLYRDNGFGPENLNVELRERLARELYVYRHADAVLYGGEAMLDRVEAECRRYGLSLLDKAVQVEHPHPAPAPAPAVRSRPLGRTRIGYVGRLERRKGILDFIETVCASPRLLEMIHARNITLELFGRDTPLPNGRMNSATIMAMAKAAGIARAVHLGGHLDQKTLWAKITNVDGLVYPSRFENYPNALLETLPLGVPTLISARGAMPHIGDWSPAVRSYDPMSSDVEASIAWLFTVAGREQYNVRAAYSERADRINAGIVAWYSSGRPPSPERTLPNLPPVSFVVIHHEQSLLLDQALAGVKNCLLEGDEVVVVDDASSSKERIAANAAASHYGCRFVSLPHNSGPAAARNAGVAAARYSLIQFCDADDILVPDGVRYARELMARALEVDMAYGAMRAFGTAKHIWWPRDSSATALERNYAHSAVLVRKSVYEKLGGQDERARFHFEDWAFNARLALSGYRAEAIPAISLDYRIGSDSRTARNTALADISLERVLASATLDRPFAVDRLKGELLDLAGIQALRIHRGEAIDPSVRRGLALVRSVRDTVIKLERRFPPAVWVLRWLWRLRAKATSDR